MEPLKIKAVNFLKKRTDRTKINFGKYKGQRIQTLPVNYLDFLLKKDIAKGKTKAWALYATGKEPELYEISLSYTTTSIKVMAYSSDDAFLLGAREIDNLIGVSMSEREYGIKNITND